MSRRLGNLPIRLQIEQIESAFDARFPAAPSPDDGMRLFR